MTLAGTMGSTAFQHAYGKAPTVVCRAPGRVNLIGEHTDYNDGLVLPITIDRSVAVTAAPRDDGVVRIYAEQFAARDEWKAAAPRRTGRREWRDYVRGVAWALLDSGAKIGGADMAIDGDLPLSAGLSSSAALELAVAGALCAVSGVEIERRKLALLCQQAENVFVGVQCGIMDQFASALGRAGDALLIDCRSLDVEWVPLRWEDRGLAIVVVDSKLPRRLAETPYNQRHEECARAAKCLGVASLRDATEPDVAHLPDPLLRRARHVVRENGRVRKAVDALTGRDPQRFGALMYESHESLRDDFEASCPELDLLVSLAQRARGVLGSRLTGAGFGGCTVSLVQADALDDFQRDVLAPYRAEAGLEAEMMVCRPADGLSVTHV